MKTGKHQSGMSIPGILVIMIMVGFFIMCAIRMAPPYFEYLSVKDIMSKVALESDPGTKSISEIRRRVGNLLNTNQIYGIATTDVEIYRKDGKTYIDSNYEVRVPIAGRIDAVMRFDDLLFVEGSKIALPPDTHR